MSSAASSVIAAEVEDGNAAGAEAELLALLDEAAAAAAAAAQVAPEGGAEAAEPPSHASAREVCRACPSLCRAEAVVGRLVGVLGASGASPSARSLAAQLLASACEGGAGLPQAVADAFVADALGARAWVDAAGCKPLVNALASPGGLSDGGEAVARRLLEAEAGRAAHPRVVLQTLAALASLAPCRKAAAARLSEWLTNPSTARAARELAAAVVANLRGPAMAVGTSGAARTSACGDGDGDGEETARLLLRAIRPGSYEGSYEHYGVVSRAFPRQAAEYYIAEGGGKQALPRAARAAHDARLVELMAPQGAVLAAALGARPRPSDRLRRLLQQAGPSEAEAFCTALLASHGGGKGGVPGEEATAIAELVAMAQLCHADAASDEWRKSAARVQQAALAWMRANALPGPGGEGAFWAGASLLLLRAAGGEADADAPASWRGLAGASPAGGTAGFAADRGRMAALAPPDQPQRVEAAAAPLPMRENTLAHLLLAGIAGDGRLRPEDVLRAAEWLVLRAARLEAASPDAACGALKLSTLSTVDGLVMLVTNADAQARRPAGDRLPPGAKTARSDLYWRAALLMTLLAAHNPGEVGRGAWAVPAVRCLLGLLAQGRGGDPRALLPRRTEDELRESLRAERELLGAELDEAGVQVVDHGDSTMPRPVPAAVLDRLWQLDAQLRLGERLRRSRDPNVMASLVEAGALEWLVPVALADPECVAALPLPALCRLYLSALERLPAARQPPRFLGGGGPRARAAARAGERDAQLAATVLAALRGLEGGDARSAVVAELVRPLAEGEPDGCAWHTAHAALWLWLAPGAPPLDNLRSGGHEGAETAFWPRVEQAAAGDAAAVEAVARAQAGIAARTTHAPTLAAALAGLCASPQGAAAVATTVRDRPLLVRQALVPAVVRALASCLSVTEHAEACAALARAAALRGFAVPKDWPAPDTSVDDLVRKRRREAGESGGAPQAARTAMMTGARQAAWIGVDAPAEHPAGGPKPKRRRTLAAAAFLAAQGDAGALEEVACRARAEPIDSFDDETVAALAERPRWALVVLASARPSAATAAAALSVYNDARERGRAAASVLDALYRLASLTFD